MNWLDLAAGFPREDGQASRAVMGGEFWCKHCQVRWSENVEHLDLTTGVKRLRPVHRSLCWMCDGPGAYDPQCMVMHYDLEAPYDGC